MVSSRAYPGLDRDPKEPSNWVDAVGGLPSYIERIAKHLHYERGMSISHAIATAVNTVKRWARKGGVVKYGDPNNMNVTVVTAAQAAKAVAQWEAKKAAARATRAGRAGRGTMGRRSVRLAEGNMIEVGLLDLAARANQIEDPVARSRARGFVLDLADLGKDCAYCDNPATHRMMGDTASGLKPPRMVTCDNPECRAKAKAALQNETGSDAIDETDLTSFPVEVIDLALTKDGRKSFKNTGRRKAPYQFKHGFKPITSAAVEAKAKGSPIARKRIVRLFGAPKASGNSERTPSGSRAETWDKGNRRSGRGTDKVTVTKEGGAQTSADRAALIRDPRIREAPKARVANPRTDRSPNVPSRATREWDEIPAKFRTIRNGKRYVVATFGGKSVISEWVGPNAPIDTKNVALRRRGSITTADAQKMTIAGLKALLEEGNQPEAVRKVLNKILREKLKVAGRE